MRAIQSEYYGDNTRWFIADVIDHTPPYGLEGRVKIRIHGVHNPSTREIQQNDLPWAQVVLPTTEAGVSGLGSSPRLTSGATVFGFFMDGKASQVPLVVGSIPKMEAPSRIQRGVVYETVTERLDQEESFYQQEVGLLNNDLIEDENAESISENTKKYRTLETIKFFLNSGYTLNQSIGLVTCLSFKSGLADIGIDDADDYKPLGVAGWVGVRKGKLKNFNNEWRRFSTQLVFVKHELNTSIAFANIKLRSTDTLEKDNPDNCQRVFGKYYMGLKKQSDFDALEKLSLGIQDLVGL